MTRRRCRFLGVAAASVLLLAACGTSPRTSTQAAPATASPSPLGTAPAEPVPEVKHKPLRPGESRVTVRMPTAYTPTPPTGVGTDDYRCFLLDPHLARDTHVTGFNVLPGSPAIVHHVILFRVPPSLVATAEARDAADPGEGWTCFGTSGLNDGAQIDNAPWLGAWAPGGGEQVYGKGLGEDFAKGSRIVMQVHYNLLAGTRPDISAAELRTSSRPGIQTLETRLVPAPVELPCRPGHTGRLCDRAAALADVKARFGDGPGSTADLLHLICGPTRPGPVQSCTRTIGAPETIRGVAGHMHLLGRSISIVVNKGRPDQRTVLDIRKWNFDNQGSTPTPPIQLKPLDTVTVTCRHSQALRDRLPAFHGQPDKYVLWGEGTTDEMCLGILLVTRP